MKKSFLKKGLLSLLTALLVILMALPATVKAESKYVVDNAGLLTDEENAELAEKLAEVSERLEIDVVVVTTTTLSGKTPMVYADDYFDNNGYGQGSEKSGVLFLRYINGSEKEVWISTAGNCISPIDSSYVDYIFDEITEEFIDGDYYAAFCEYADLVDERMTEYAEKADSGNSGNSGNSGYSGNSGNSGYDSGSSGWDYDFDFDYDYDYGYDDGFSFSNVLDFLGSYTIWMYAIPLAIGLLAAFIYTSTLKSQLKSVQAAREARAFQSNFELIDKRDRFIRSTVSKVRKPDDNDNNHGSMGGGGGGGVHTSSAGVSHGGGGRSM